MNDEKFIIIPEWMIDIGLRGNRLLVYAVIYGYSRNGGWFQGSASYLCKRTGMSDKGVRKVLRSLCDDGFLQKRDRPYKGMKYVDYQAITPTVQSTEGNNVPGSKVQRGTVQSTADPRYRVPTKVNKKVKTKESIRARGNKFHNFQQREYDYDELERRLTELKGGEHG